MNILKKKFNVCFFTSTRADIASIQSLIKLFESSSKSKPCLIVSGTHLSKAYGYSIKNIKIKKKTKIYKIKTKFNKDSPDFVCRKSSDYIKKISNLICNIKPDIIVLVGDRYEVLMAAYVAHIHNTPVAHLGGGEVTRGVIDEAFRHSITKMSFLHFTTRKKYASRVSQLGEEKKNIFFVGDTSQEYLRKIKLYKISELEKNLKIKLYKKNILINYHPVTLDRNFLLEYKNLLSVISKYKNLLKIFTYPNVDSQNKLVIEEMKNFKKKHPQSTKIFKNLGDKNFLSIVKNVDLVIGNSSSGITDAPLLGVPSVDIGERQSGREKPVTVISCGSSINAISQSIKKALNLKIKKNRKIKSESLNSLSSFKIFKTIESKLPIKSIKKTFIDL
jgi:GDP/UDP-N,N'-diacetylbacillosamine 2-epimerase (hydrolysing)